MNMVKNAITNVVSMFCHEKGDVSEVLDEDPKTTTKRRNDEKLPWEDALAGQPIWNRELDWFTDLILFLLNLRRSHLPLRLHLALLQKMVRGSGYVLVPEETAVRLDPHHTLNVTFVPTPPKPETGQPPQGPT